MVFSVFVLASYHVILQFTFHIPVGFLRKNRFFKLAILVFFSFSSQKYVNFIYSNSSSGRSVGYTHSGKCEDNVVKIYSLKQKFAGDYCRQLWILLMFGG